MTEALVELRGLSLVKPSLESRSRHRVVHPEVSLGVLLDRREAEVLESRRSVATARAAVNGMLAGYRDRQLRAGDAGVRRVSSLDAVYAHSERLSRACRRDVAIVLPECGFAPEGRVAPTVDTAHLSPDVTVRYLAMDAARAEPAARSWMDRLASGTAQVRTAMFLPPRMTIYDGHTAIIDVDPAQPAEGALVLDHPGPVAALGALFDSAWQQACLYGELPVGADQALTHRERIVTELLAAGYTDDAVANRLGVSVRTARRIIAELMKRLRASSRFQAGARAAERGWLSRQAS